MTQPWSGVWERASCRWHTLMHVSFLQHWSAPCRRTRCWPSPTPRTASSCGSVWGRPLTPTSRSCRPWFPGPKAQARATRLDKISKVFSETAAEINGNGRQTPRPGEPKGLGHWPCYRKIHKWFYRTARLTDGVRADGRTDGRTDGR